MVRTERNGHNDLLRLAGRYRLHEKLGTGGMSVVWRGYDEILGREVAVKVLSPRLAEDHAFRDRLRQEALAAARLRHPHITGVHDFGEAPISEHLTVPYVVMELNDGESLGARIGRQGSLDWREAVLITAEVASALATAHARGLVHRDITPANVMLTGAGAKIVDFGISAVVGQHDAAADGSLLGTPAYLAPERLGGATVSPATDVYALGLLLYRALTGRMPWPAGSTAEALRAHLYADPEPVPELAGMPVFVADLCLRCLAKSPADRPAAGEVARALAASIGVRAIIPPLRPGERHAAPTARVAAPVPGRAIIPPLRRRLRAYLGGPAAEATRPVRHRDQPSLPGQRRRTPAVVLLATATLIAATAINWTARRAIDAAERSQTTATEVGTPAAAAPDRVSCRIRYQVRRDSGSHFEARLSVVTTEASGWRVEFAYPGTQRLTAGREAVTQNGRRVVVNGKGRSRAVTLHGGYRTHNPLPLSFTLNGRPCRAEVLGGVTWRTRGGSLPDAGDRAVQNPVTAVTPDESKQHVGTGRRNPPSGSRRPGPPVKRGPDGSPTAL